MLGQDMRSENACARLERRRWVRVGRAEGIRGHEHSPGEGPARRRREHRSAGTGEPYCEVDKTQGAGRVRRLEAHRELEGPQRAFRCRSRINVEPERDRLTRDLVRDDPDRKPHPDDADPRPKRQPDRGDVPREPHSCAAEQDQRQPPEGDHRHRRQDLLHELGRGLPAAGHRDRL